MDITRRRFTQTALAGAGLTSIFGLSACDRSSKVLPKLSMQSAWINDAEFMGYFIGLENGYYKEEGIDFEYLPGGPEVVADSVLLARRADIALTTPDTTVNAIVNNDVDIKIIGAQYQKNPIGIVSLEENGINEPSDLVGKRLAVPPANVLTVEAMFRLNQIDPESVEIVPYQYDPGPLLRGEVDATLDFVTNVPFTIREKGAKPTSFLLYDYGYKTFNDTVAVHADTLETKRNEILAWLRASRKGWIENFANLGVYEEIFASTWFDGTGRSIENEKFFNRAQQSLMEAPGGYFSMSEQAIEDCIESLKAIGVSATRDMFVTDLFDEL